MFKKKMPLDVFGCLLATEAVSFSVYDENSIFRKLEPHVQAIIAPSPMLRIELHVFGHFTQDIIVRKALGKPNLKVTTAMLREIPVIINTTWKDEGNSLDGIDISQIYADLYKERILQYEALMIGSGDVDIMNVIYKAYSNFTNDAPPNIKDIMNIMVVWGVYVSNMPKAYENPLSQDSCHPEWR
jgi:hypothetical protein